MILKKGSSSWWSFLRREMMSAWYYPPCCAQLEWMAANEHLFWNRLHLMPLAQPILWWLTGRWEDGNEGKQKEKRTQQGAVTPPTWSKRSLFQDRMTKEGACCRVGEAAQQSWFFFCRLEQLTFHFLCSTRLYDVVTFFFFSSHCFSATGIWSRRTCC